MAQQKNFLPHIHGIRGLAILLILLFHLMPNWFPRGYIGVDIFLTISGYFLIGKELNSFHGFNVAGFLKSKILRVYPPILLLTLFLLPVYIILFPAEQMEDAAKVTLSFLFGYCNQYLVAKTSSYFSADTRLYPLMHLWYVSMMIQAFLCFGALFILWHILHLRKTWRITSLVIITFISFSLYHPSLAGRFFGYEKPAFYYCTLPRLWEFSLGGLITIFPRPQYKKWHQILSTFISLTIIAICIFIACRHEVFDSPDSICAISSRKVIAAGVIGGSALIYFGAGGVGKNILNCKLLQATGAISYSLYLVHWPYVCFIEFIHGDLLPVSTAVMLLAGIVPSAILLYYIAERKRFGICGIVLMWVTILSGCYLITYTEGFLNYIHQKTNSITNDTNELPTITSKSPLSLDSEGIKPNQWLSDTGPRPLLKLIGKNEGSTNFVLLGDSHALKLSEGLHTVACERGWNGVYLNSYIVPFWGDELSDNFDPGIIWNKEKAEALIRWLKRHPELHHVFIAQFWKIRFHAHPTWNNEYISGTKEEIQSARLEELRETCKILKSIGKEIYLFTDNPTISEEHPLIKIRHMVQFGESQVLPDTLICTQEKYQKDNAAIENIMQKLENEGLCKVIRGNKIFFVNGSFCAYDGKELLMMDKQHLSWKGTILYARGIQEEMDKILLP